MLCVANVLRSKLCKEMKPKVTLLSKDSRPVLDLPKLSLLVSGLSFGLFAIQTIILWHGRNQSVEAPLIQMRAEACKTLIENYQEFSNLNATLRVVAGRYMNQAPDSIEMGKSDYEPSPVLSEEDHKRALVRSTRAAADSGYRAHTHANTILHLFSKDMRKTIIESQSLIMPLISEPLGNSRVHPDDFSGKLELIMRECQNMTDRVLVDGT